MMGRVTVTLGSETDGDTIETVYGPLRGYNVAIETVGEINANEVRILDVGDTWLVSAINDDGKIQGEPFTIEFDNIEAIEIY